MQSGREEDTVMLSGWRQWCLCFQGDRIKLHCYKHVAFFEGIKECRGYTVLFLLVIKGKKSVGYTVCLHHNDGRKECGVHCLSPSLMEEKSVGYTVCLHL